MSVLSAVALATSYGLPLGVVAALRPEGSPSLIVAIGVVCTIDHDVSNTLLDPRVDAESRYGIRILSPAEADGTHLYCFTQDRFGMVADPTRLPVSLPHPFTASPPALQAVWSP